LITENQLDEWVRSNAREAQGIIVELVWRLVAASCPRPKERRFPLGDSIGQHGPDGLLDVDSSFEPFIPTGRSSWEIGTGLKAGDKATSDYNKLTDATPESVRHESTFVFVTPLSARRDWKQNAQTEWIKERKGQNEWKDVCVIDGTKLIDWVHQHPAVERWLSNNMGIPAEELETPELRWNVLETIGEPPRLSPQIFLVNRESACAKLKDVFDCNLSLLKFETHFLYQLPDFVAAYLATLDEETRIELNGRCLIVSTISLWNTICEQYHDLFLIALPTIDLSGHEGTVLLERAEKSGHLVIYSGLPGGIPNENTISLHQPKVYQLSKALEETGYSGEQARILAQKSGGNLSTLLKLLKKISLTPEWVQGPDVADLAIAMLLGGWDDNNESDRKIVETLSEKPYSEWINKIRTFTICQDSPLIQQDGKWKFIARYEGWYALGPRLYNENIDLFRRVAVTVLRENDPKFDLPADKRFAAQIYGKVPIYSQSLRTGIVESLALLGCHPKALTYSSKKAEATVILAVREIMSDRDWVLWASLNDVLPLLAEAAPNEFLKIVERALRETPSMFDDLFAQESAILGINYMTGLLWAIETLAWDPNNVIRAITILGALAARDPGGNYANRPLNSIKTILLPSLPQTCATILQRRTAVATLLNERPDVAWKVLLSLLPEPHSISSYTRRPAWREFIYKTWSESVTNAEYWDQVNGYAELAINVAEGNVHRLSEIIKRLTDLPSSTHDQIMIYLESDTVLGLPDTERVYLWTALTELATEHRKFADTDWAMKSQQVDKIEVIAERLAPKSPELCYKRLFKERYFDLYDEQGSFDEQANRVELRRQNAVREIFESGGIRSVIDFAGSVESPFNVGFSFGFIATSEEDRSVLPILLDNKQEALTKFTTGFVRGRLFYQTWSWADSINTEDWTPDQIAQFLSCLPFSLETWGRSVQFLGSDESGYWTRTTANPYEAQTNLEYAADKLVEYGRPHAAIRCLHRMMGNKHVNSAMAIIALIAALNSSEDKNVIDVYAIVEIIKALQDDPTTNQDDLLRVEWAYLHLLNHDRDASPISLERRLASDPEFFCMLIRSIFRSKKEDRLTEEPTEQVKNIAANAYNLLSNSRTPPGLREDGCFDSDALVSWINRVKIICSETGHLENALQWIGHMLMYVPPDPDELWIDRSVAAILNAEDSEEMRLGFRIELYNSWGAEAHWVDPTGKPERELADKYRKQADDVEVAGYHLLAITLRELAEDYDQEVERIISHAQLDD